MTELSKINAVILAGGLGTRLRAAVSDRPKGLAPVLGRPFLSYLLDRLDTAGIQNAVLCTGYLGDQVEHAFGSRYRGMRLAYSQESAPLGTGGALRLALPMLESDPVLVLNGDSYFEADLVAMMAWHRTQGSEATLLVTHMPDTCSYGRVALSETGAILDFVEKGSLEGPGWINAGVYILGRHVIEAIPPNGAVSLEKEVFPAWIGRGLHGCPGEGVLLDIGTPERLAAASEYFARNEGNR